MFNSRKLTFQLTPLLDLLLIVIFAQYMEVEETSKQETAKVQQKLDLLESHRGPTSPLEVARLNQQLMFAQQQMINLQTRIEALQLQSQSGSQELQQSLAQQERLGMLTTTLFQLPEKLVAEVLKPTNSANQNRSPEELQRLKAEFRKYADHHARETLKHLVAHDELRKRCDIWEMQVITKNDLEQGEMEVHVKLKTDLNKPIHTADQFRRQYSRKLFEDKTREEIKQVLKDIAHDLSSELFKLYKTQPEPKSLVVILFTYQANIPRWSRIASLEGLRLASERMRADTNNRTRFEYAVLGFPTEDSSTLLKQFPSSRRD